MFQTKIAAIENLESIVGARFGVIVKTMVKDYG
jgi:hypothetical protein